MPRPSREAAAFRQDNRLRGTPADRVRALTRFAPRSAPARRGASGSFMRVRSRRLAVGSGRRSSSRRYAAQYIGPGWHAGSLLALRRYGMFVADNGNDWFVSGSTDSRWNDTELDQRKSVPASAFEVVQAGPIIR